MSRQLTADVRQLQERVDRLESFLADTFGDVDPGYDVAAPLDDVATEAETDAPETADDLVKLTRDELDERARTAGIDAPEELPNKAAVADAIVAARQ